MFLKGVKDIFKRVKYVAKGVNEVFKWVKDVFKGGKRYF